MRKIQITIISSLALGLLMGFQNCSGAHFEEAASPTDQSSQSTSGVSGIPSSASNVPTASPTPSTTPAAPAVNPPAATTPAASVPVVIAPVATQAPPSSSAPVVTKPPVVVVQPPTTSGNQVQNQIGQRLAFVNNTGVSIGDASVVDANNGVLRLYNNLSNRYAYVKIQIDRTSGEFLSVDLAPGQSVPFMCHDPSANPCAGGYWNPSAGTTEANCASPINYNGSLNGSIRNLSGTGAWQYYGCQ